MGPRVVTRNSLAFRGLTFELSRHQRCDARARAAKMYRVPLAGPAWHAVGARLERGVRLHSAWQDCARLAAREHGLRKGVWPDD